MPTLLDDEVQSPEVQDDQVLFAAASVDLGRNRVPGRGLLYSFLVHEIVILWILCHPDSYSTKERHFRLIEQIPLESELLLPPVGGGDSGASGQEGATKRVRGKNKKRGASRGKAAAKHLYPGPQPMASKSPNPDNSFQTILQPDLIKPPILKVPLPLPNMMQLAATLPPPPPAAHKIFEPPAPPQPPEAPKLHGNLRSAAIEIPVLVPPPAPFKPKITLPPPSQEVAALHTLATASRLRELAKATPSLTAPVAPQNPPSRASSAGTDTRNILALSVFPSTSRLAIQVPQVEAHGDFAIGPHPPTAGPEPGTTRGDSTEISSLPPEISGPGLAALGKGLASEASPVGEVGNGTGASVESGPGLGHTGLGPGSGAETGAGAGDGKSSSPGAGAGTGKGTGAGAGVGPGAGPFAGMSIVGGAGSAASSGAGRPFGPEASGSYGLTVVAAGPSGGGIRDFGVFSDEPVYTVYIDMRRNGEPAPSWTMEYALLAKRPAIVDPPGAVSLRLEPESLHSVVPPFPATKETPQFPPDVISKYLGQMIVVYGVLSPEGKLLSISVMASPNTELNSSVLDALDRWVFQPVLLNGKPVAAKVLLGIPLFLADRANASVAAASTTPASGASTSAPPQAETAAPASSSVQSDASGAAGAANPAGKPESEPEVAAAQELTPTQKKIAALEKWGDEFLDRGEYEKAIRQYQSALALNPANAGLRQKLEGALKARSH